MIIVVMILIMINYDDINNNDINNNDNDNIDNNNNNNNDIVGTMRHCTLVSRTPSQSIGLVSGCELFWCWLSLYVPLTNSLKEFYFIMAFVTIFGIFMAIFYFELHVQAFSNKVVLVLQMCTSVDVSALVYSLWFEHVIFGLLYVIVRIYTRILYRGVSGFATDCPWSVRCRGLTTCLLYIGPLFENLVWNDSGLVSWHNEEQLFHCFWLWLCIMY